MLHTHFDGQYDHFLDDYEGHPVRILRDRKTGQTLFPAESVARILGYADQHDMLSRDEVLDLIGQHQQQHGESPLLRLPPKP